MVLRKCLIAMGCLFSMQALASSGFMLISNPEELDNRWSIIASVGYSELQHVYHTDGRTAVGRMALAAELLTSNHATFGLELGMQSGNRMRLFIPQGTIDALGCMVTTTVRPMLDLLVTANASPLNESLFFTLLKGGITYRHWKINSNLFESKSEIAGEVQAGFGYPLTEITSLNLIYQGIFGGNPKTGSRPLEAGYLANIPIQHGILLGFSIIA